MRPHSVWLDAQGAQNAAHFDRGIPRYVSEQLRSLLALAPEAVHTVALDAEQPFSDNLAFLRDHDRVVRRTARDGPPASLPALYHVMSPFELERSLDHLWPGWARVPDVATVVTLFDLIPFVFDDHYLHDPVMRTRYEARANFLRSVDHVLALSAATARDATELLDVPPERITVIDAGVSSAFLDHAGDASDGLSTLRARYPQLREGFMLYVAGIEFRKNIERLIEAYGVMEPALRARHQLVITCKVLPDERARLERVAAEAGLAEGEILITGYVSDSELAALYRLTRLFVFPSFYEGSGLPMLEAMSCGVPVAASNTSTSPEILGDLEATFDPFDVADIARVLAATVADDATLERLRARSRRRVAHYTWEHVGRRTLEGYSAALEARAGRAKVVRERPRVALLTPWPPERSGLADYNARLAPALARHADVDVVVDSRRSDHVVPDTPGLRLVPSDSFRWWGRWLEAYDRVLYCMGNSHYHGWIYKVLKEHPGVVVAHDVRLTGFYGWYAGQERPHDPTRRLMERIQQFYGDRVDSRRWRDRPPTPEEQGELDLYMTCEVQEHAHALVAHSQSAAEILRRDRPGDWAIDTPVHVVPHAMPSARPRTPWLDRPLIVSFGILSRVKDLEALIEAFALLAERHPTARLYLAGGGDPGEAEHWSALAHRLGVGDRVELPGHVTQRQYDDLLAQASVSVQLRLAYNGEASGAVAKNLAAGLPTIVTDVGWFGELPDDAVVKVPMGVEPDALATEIERLLEDRDHAAAVSGGARLHAERTSFRAVARSYAEALLPHDRNGAKPVPIEPLRPAPVTLVIATRDRCERVLLALASHARQSFRDFAVVIADDGSTDGTREEIERLARTPEWSGRLSWVGIPGGPSGSTRPRNVGAAHAAPDTSLLLFIDSDVVLTPTAIERALELHGRHPEAALFCQLHWLGPADLEDVQATLDSEGVEGLSSLVPRAPARRLEGTIVGIDPRGAELFSPNASATPAEVRPELAVGGLVAVPTAVFERLGGYDESLGVYGYDDMEFGIRLRKAGVQSLLPSEVTGFHIWHPKNDWARMSVYNERNLDIVLRKHGLDATPDKWADWSVWWHYHADREGRVAREDGRLWAIDRGDRFKLELPSEDWVARLGHSPGAIRDAGPGELDRLRSAGVAAELPVERPE